MWNKIKAWFWRICGNSRTLLAAYIIEILAYLDEFKVIDWSSPFGVEHGGRIAAILGAVMIVLRLITSGPVMFKAQV